MHSMSSGARLVLSFWDGARTFREDWSWAEPQGCCCSSFAQRYTFLSSCSRRQLCAGTCFHWVTAAAFQVIAALSGLWKGCLVPAACSWPFSWPSRCKHICMGCLFISSPVCCVGTVPSVNCANLATSMHSLFACGTCHAHTLLCDAGQNCCARHAGTCSQLLWHHLSHMNSIGSSPPACKCQQSAGAQVRRA